MASDKKDFKERERVFFLNKRLEAGTQQPIGKRSFRSADSGSNELNHNS